MYPDDLPPVPDVSPRDASQLLEAQDAVLIDIREPDEWAESRVPRAILRPMSTIREWYQDLPTDRPIIVLCRSGSRSHAVVHALTAQAGMTNVVNLRGGILAWAEDELPIDTGE